MRIVELTITTKNLDILRNIKFNLEGMNLIVDNSDKSGNNVGKTTVLKLIDICLGAKEKKYIYEENETKAENSELKNYIETEKITVTLKVRKNDEDTELKVELFERGKRFINGEVLKYESYVTKLKELFFGNNLKKPSFRQLIGKFIRVDQKQDNNRFIKYINASVSTKDYEAIYSFLFNLQDQNKIDYLSNIKKDIKDTENDIKVIKKMYNFKTIDELNQIIFVFDNDKQRLNEQIKEYIHVEESREFEKERIKLREEYQKFLEVEENLEFAIKKAKEIIENEKAKNQNNKIDESILKLLYDEVARNYNGLDKTFEDLIQFNYELSKNKINFYKELIKRKQKELNILIENKEKFFENPEIRKLMYTVSDPEFMGKVILENDSPAIFSHSHPSSDILNKAKEDFENIKEKSNFNFSETPYIAYFKNNNLLEKKLLLSTVKEWIGQFKIPIRVTSNSDSEITFRIEKYLVGTNNMNDLYYYINYKYGSNIKSDEEFLNTLPVIPLLQEYDTVLSHSNVRGLNVSPSGDIYLKYINMQ